MTYPWTGSSHILVIGWGQPFVAHEFSGAFREGSGWADYTVCGRQVSDSNWVPTCFIDDRKFRPCKLCWKDEA